MGSAYVNKKVRQLGKEILDGGMMLNPYESGTESACTYCAFKSVCGFDKKMPGFAVNRLADMDKEEAMEAIRRENEKG